jgi:hypothetical protein
MFMTKVVKFILFDGFCVYGSLKKSGFITVSIRRTNGMVAYTPSLTEKNPIIGMKVPFYLPKKWIKNKQAYDTTFIFSLVGGFRKTFG